MNKKIQNWRAPALFALCLLPFAAVGGWCTGSYSLASFPEELQQTVLSQAGGAMPLYFLTAVQSVLLAFVCGAVGYALSRTVGLMRRWVWKRRNCFLPWESPWAQGYSSHWTIGPSAGGCLRWRKAMTADFSSAGWITGCPPFSMAGLWRKCCSACSSCPLRPS